MQSDPGHARDALPHAEAAVDPVRSLPMFAELMDAQLETVANGGQGGAGGVRRQER